MSSIGYIVKEEMYLASERAQLEIRRRRVLMGCLIGFIVMQLPYLYHYFTSDSGTELSGWSVPISLVGWLIWSYYLIRNVSFTRLLQKKRELAKSLNDEYIQNIRTRSFAIGFWVVLGVVTILLVLSTFIDLNVRFVLFSLIFTAVVASLGSYLIIEKD